MKQLVILIALISTIGYAQTRLIDLKMAAFCTKTEYHYKTWGTSKLTEWYIGRNGIHITEFSIAGDSIIKKTDYKYEEFSGQVKRNSYSVNYMHESIAKARHTHKKTIWEIIDPPNYEGKRNHLGKLFDIKTAYGFDRYHCSADIFDYHNGDWVWDFKPSWFDSLVIKTKQRRRQL